MAVLCLLLAAHASAGERPALFGSREFRSANLEPFPKWLGILQRCNDAEGLFGLLPDDLRSQLAPHRGDSLMSQMQFANRLVNRQAYRTDAHNWGERDRWSPPEEFLQRGGDCEDFAVTKYIALRFLGVPPDDVRIAVVQDVERGMKHAIVAVYEGDVIWILDNQVQEIRRSSDVHRYRPIYTINENHWWKHEPSPG